MFPNTRLGLPEEFAKMAVAILENKHLGTGKGEPLSLSGKPFGLLRCLARFVNGESIRVDGGIRMSKL